MIKKSISILAIVVTMILLATACGSGEKADLSANIPPKNQNTSTQAINLTPTNGSIDAGSISKDDQAYAYYLVFCKLMEDDPGLSAGIKYIGLDLSKTKLDGPENLIALVQDYCDKREYTLLIGNYEQLVGAGYINGDELYWEDGNLVSFADVGLSPDRLKTAASKWASGTGAIGSTYTVKKNDSKWSIIDETNFWIS